MRWPVMQRESGPSRHRIPSEPPIIANQAALSPPGRSHVKQHTDGLPNMDSSNRFREKRRNREDLHVGQSLLGWNRHGVGGDDFRDVGLRAKARNRLAR